jgi:hypothetical protein
MNPAPGDPQRWAEPMEDEIQEEQWVNAQRDAAIAYLQKENVDHLGVGEWPAFHVSPYVAIWAVQSKADPGRVGWWVITGDCPSDYISGAGITNPREAMIKFSNNWKAYSVSMKDGRNPLDIEVGNDANRRELGTLLETRSEILEEWAKDVDMWRDILDDEELPNQ